MSPLDFAHEPVRRWFMDAFAEPTPAQAKGWPAIAGGSSTLLLAPTGSGKTLAAFLAAIDRLMFSPEPAPEARLKVLYVSPLKALGVDVERNLAAPIAGIRATAERLGVPHRIPMVGVRSGDTPQADRARMLRQPPDILITTPESLYLLLTSGARSILGSIDTVIVDEIHTMVPTKRGAHLFSSLERLESLRAGSRPLQRVGLSATQRPLDEVARLLGGGEIEPGGGWRARPVTVIDAGTKRPLELTVEVPIEDMAALAASPEEEGAPSIWPSIHPRLVELVRAHRTTMIFVNSRRLAERLASALNEEAGEELALAHHGSMAKDARQLIEERLKRGQLPAIVATSSLELGLDIGSVDLVVQIEAPPSVAAGLQRVGRANHQVGARPRGIFFPKFRGDLLATAATTERMHAGVVEESYYPRSPLDVLAQQLTAMISVAPQQLDALYDEVRRAAPFAELPRASYEGVLDMLSGRFVDDALSELKPRVTWDRVTGRLEARRGAARIAILNGGTIPDRGVYGVFLAGEDERGRSRRVGELDEEMVFESRVGEVFLLGASSWRIEDITHDRVVVSPAPGEPGKMPFWRGDRPGRPLELGRAIGALAKRLADLERGAAERELAERHGLDARAAKNLCDYLAAEKEATGEVPSDRVIVLERFVDEIGDWRVCILSPFGGRVHAPWGMAVRAKLRAASDAEIDVNWSDDGIVFRLPEHDAPPDPALFVPSPEELEALVVRELGETSLFGARFRENAGRALLFPRRDPRRRQPLWATRRKAANLLAVASKYPSFPIVLETYRECLRDVFDMPALSALMRELESRRVRLAVVDTRKASPFAASLLFSYVANYMYEGDGPIAERRAQALALDHAQLRQLLGASELRTLLDASVIEAHEARLQLLDPRYRIAHADALHDALRRLGDLSREELALRCEGAPDGWISALLEARRVFEVRVAGQARLACVEDLSKLRDALGVATPPGVALAFLEPHPDPLGALVARYARTHGPFTVEAVAARFGLGVAPVRDALERLRREDRLLVGEFLLGGHGEEYCDAEVLRGLKRASLARLRREVEPVDGAALARFMLEWQGIGARRRGLDAVLSAVEQLQGAPLVASTLETELLPARVEGYSPGDLDELCAAGEVVWRGLEPVGLNDGRIALYLTDAYDRLAPAPGLVEGERADAIRRLLAERGALFFGELLTRLGGFPQDVLGTLWEMVWAGELRNDTLVPLRSLLSGSEPRRDRRFRSRRTALPGSEGRWSLQPRIARGETERRAALVAQLLERYGVLTREGALAEGVPFTSIYPVLKAMEDAGRVRRGYFVAGLGAAQFSLPGADDRLRSFRERPSADEPARVLAATDPASVFGAAIAWPEREEGARPQRAAGAQVVLCEGRLVAWIGRSSKSVLTFLPDEEPDRARLAEALSTALAREVEEGPRRALLIESIDGAAPAQSAVARYLGARGFASSSKGYLKRKS